MAAPVLRIARPVRDLARARDLYVAGMGLRVAGGFADHQGFDGVMLDLPGAGWHLEFTACRHHPVAPAPTAEDLLVLYLADDEAWHAACERALGAGFVEVRPFNPYWSVRARTFADHDGYRTVLCRDTWPQEATP